MISGTKEDGVFCVSGTDPPTLFQEKIMKFLLHLLLPAVLFAAAAFQTVTLTAAEVKTVASPSGIVKMDVSVGETLTWSLTFDGKTVLAPSKLGLTFKNAPALGEMKIADCSVKTINETWSNPLSKKSTYTDHCTEMTLKVAETAAPNRELVMVFRAYDDGIALRYIVPDQAALPGAFVLTSDDTQFAFTGDWTCWASDQKKFNTSQEKEFPQMKLSDITDDAFAICPLVVSGDFGYCALMESDLLKWAGAQFAAVPGGNKAGGPCTIAVRLTPRADGNGCVLRETGAKSPWRVVTLGKKAVDLVNNSGIVLNCATPCVLEDTSWIEAGASSWDWWSEGNKVLNTDTLKARIDLAAANGWKFTTLDDPWYFNSKFQYKPEYLTDTASGCGTIDLPEAFAYAKSKGVRICLWMHYQDFDFCGHERTFTAYEKWGAAGMKIDFMDSDNQERVEWIEDVVKNAAKHRLMINFHGMYKPTGMERTYPNQITREGILGNEYNKFGEVTPKHCATLPFTRWLCGPGDFTPGGFVNRQPEHAYRQKNLQTPTCCEQGTRAHALAMCLITDSPCLTICDSPWNYANQPGFSFLKDIPAVWDETVAVDGEIGEFYLHYRRSGEKFYAGAITNADARELALKLDFLKPGKTYTAKIFCDTQESGGPNVKDAEKIAVLEQEVTSADTLSIRMVRNGGWTAIFTEK
ncbi:MAG: glycoside hydrolase family 97 protein [Planctomycetaceae bacterium]|nr:glycoside hydrolase family 97 protein [Planctomycetaceae bacterium]